LLTFNTSFAQPDTLGWRLDHFKYPYKVRIMHSSIQRNDVDVFYMDEKPANWNGQTVILLHGKNFPAAYWGKTIGILVKEGYRVVAPDQPGFGKSSKHLIDYSFSMLCSVTRQLMDTLGIKTAHIVGHSTGGMLAMHFAVTYPDRLNKLVLQDPLGLEDWQAMGAPPRTIDDWYKDEIKLTYEDVLNNQQQYYYNWDEQYRIWADVQYGQMKGPHMEQSAQVSARLYNMIYTQPVVCQIHDIKAKTLLIIGNNDKTKLARGAKRRVARKLGNYRQMGKWAVKEIPDARLIAYDDCGHLPMFEKEAEFHRDLIGFLAEH
jgi:pimeloyl-ACP methyl ester carboxylesterase